MFGVNVPGGAGDREAARGGGSRDLLRLAILLVFALVVGGAMLQTLAQGQRYRAERDAAEADDPRLAGQPRGKARPIEDPVPPAAEPRAPVTTTPGTTEPGQEPPRAVDGGAPPVDVPAARPAPPPFVEDPEILKGIEQCSPEIEPGPLYHLLHKMVAADPATLQAQAHPLRYERMLATPEQYVGQPVRFTGRLMWLRANDREWSADPVINPSRVTAGLWGLLANQSWQAVHFYTADLPMEVRVRDIVEVDGYFVKVYEFETASRAKQMAPIIVARNFRVQRPPEREAIQLWGVRLQVGSWKPDWLAVILFGAALASLPFLWWYLRVERRKYAEYRREALARARVAMARAPGAPEPISAAAPGGAAPSGPGPEAGAPAPPGGPAPA